MKMQMREFLVLPTVDDQPVGRQLIFGNQALDGGDDVRQEGIGWIKLRKGTDGSFWEKDDVERVFRPGMKKGQQGIRLPQAFDGEDKGHVVQHPDKDPVEEGAA